MELVTIAIDSHHPDSIPFWSGNHSSLTFKVKSSLSE